MKMIETEEKDRNKEEDRNKEKESKGRRESGPSIQNFSFGSEKDLLLTTATK